jgi:hypothetical protein
MKKKDVGLKIVVKNRVVSSSCGGTIRVAPQRDLEYALLDCLDEKYTMEVVAVSLYDAIEKILYNVDALSGEKRKFFLSQIALHLKEVVLFEDEVHYEVEEILSHLIREDRLFRIHTHEEILLKKEGKNLWRPPVSVCR